MNWLWCQYKGTLSFDDVSYPHHHPIKSTYSEIVPYVMDLISRDLAWGIMNYIDLKWRSGGRDERFVSALIGRHWDDIHQISVYTSHKSFQRAICFGSAATPWSGHLPKSKGTAEANQHLTNDYTNLNYAPAAPSIIPSRSSLIRPWRKK